jgi:hypothetical protein
MDHMRRKRLDRAKAVDHVATAHLDYQPPRSVRSPHWANVRDEWNGPAFPVTVKQLPKQTETR